MATTWGEFFDLVAKVRECQKGYFKNPSSERLLESKALEKELDECIRAHRVRMVAPEKLTAEGLGLWPDSNN